MSRFLHEGALCGIQTSVGLILYFKKRTYNGCLITKFLINAPMASDIGEKCAVFGVYGKGIDVSRLTFFGLYALQHRGQESSGIATGDGETVHCHKGMGLVANVFNEENVGALAGHIAVGHNRYSTSGNSDIENAQPAIVEDVGIALAHNGNLPETKKLETFLDEHAIPHTHLNDSRKILHAIATRVRGGDSLEEAVQKTYPLMTGVFSLLVMDKDTLIAVRDSNGIRPLSIGAIKDGVVFASETCAFGPTEAAYVRDVRPGEMVVVDAKGMRSVQIEEGSERLDLFEFVYFARPDSTLMGKSVYGVRKNFGIELAREFLVSADVVIPVPETSIPVAIGYARETGIPYEVGLTKNRYIHRTFIQPAQKTREQNVKMKLTPIPEVIRGKHVVLIDDSIVRGTTSRAIIAMMYGVGAREITFLISSPPVKYPDFYGIDIQKQEHLLAAHKSVEEMRAYLGVDRLYFLSLDGAIRATGLPKERFCTSCFTGEYPVAIGAHRQSIKKI